MIAWLKEKMLRYRVAKARKPCRRSHHKYVASAWVAGALYCEKCGLEKHIFPLRHEERRAA